MCLHFVFIPNRVRSRHAFPLDRNDADVESSAQRLAGPALVVDSREIVRSANKGALGLLNGLAPRLLGRPFATVLPRWLSGHGDCEHSVLQSDIGNDFVSKLMRDDGTSICIGVTLYWHQDPDLASTKIALMRDLSDGYTYSGIRDVE